MHGFEETVWPVMRLAFELNVSTRVGFEDCRWLPNGEIAASNADLVRAALELRQARD
jgi:uncharacterized protein (DUF849 family)